MNKDTISFSGLDGCLEPLMWWLPLEYRASFSFVETAGMPAGLYFYETKLNYKPTNQTANEKNYFTADGIVRQLDKLWTAA